MSNAEMFSVFGEFKPSEYEEEAQQRWGESDAYRESARRTKDYRKEDWQQIKAEADELLNRLAELMDQGIKADQLPALAAVEDYRLHICRWFYECPRAMHRELGKMYRDDARFKKTFENVRPGLAEFVAAATAANAERTES